MHLEVPIQVAPLCDHQHGMLWGQQAGDSIRRLEVLLRRASDGLEVLGQACDRLLGLFPPTLGDELHALLHESDLHPTPDCPLCCVWNGTSSSTWYSACELDDLPLQLLYVGCAWAAFGEICGVP